MIKYSKIGRRLFFFPEYNFLLKAANKNLSKVINLIERKYEKRNSFLDDPFVDFKMNYFTRCSLFTSSKCPLKCSYCYYSAGENSEQNRDLKISDLDVIISKLIENSVLKKLIGLKDYSIDVTLTGGGEPTFNWDNFTYFVTNIKKKSHEKDIPCCLTLVTNGIISDGKIDFIIDNIDNVQISYDGLSYIQDRNRKFASGLNSSSVVEKTMRYFSNHNKEVSVRSTVLKSDYNKIPLVSKIR